MVCFLMYIAQSLRDSSVKYIGAPVMNSQSMRKTVLKTELCGNSLTSVLPAWFSWIPPASAIPVHSTNNPLLSFSMASVLWSSVQLIPFSLELLQFRLVLPLAIRGLMLTALLCFLWSRLTVCQLLLLCELKLLQCITLCFSQWQVTQMKIAGRCGSWYEVGLKVRIHLKCL